MDKQGESEGLDTKVTPMMTVPFAGMDLLTGLPLAFFVERRHEPAIVPENADRPPSGDPPSDPPILRVPDGWSTTLDCAGLGLDMLVDLDPPLSPADHPTIQPGPRQGKNLVAVDPGRPLVSTPGLGAERPEREAGGGGGGGPEQRTGDEVV